LRRSILIPRPTVSLSLRHEDRPTPTQLTGGICPTKWRTSRYCNRGFCIDRRPRHPKRTCHKRSNQNRFNVRIQSKNRGRKIGTAVRGRCFRPVVDHPGCCVEVVWRQNSIEFQGCRVLYQAIRPKATLIIGFKVRMRFYHSRSGSVRRLENN
jgi:hypothetical protein